MKKALCHSWNFQYHCGANHAFHVALLIWRLFLVSHHQLLPLMLQCSLHWHFCCPPPIPPPQKKFQRQLCVAFGVKCQVYKNILYTKTKKKNTGSWRKIFTWHVFPPNTNITSFEPFLLLLLFCSMTTTIFSTFYDLHSYKWRKW